VILNSKYVTRGAVVKEALVVPRVSSYLVVSKPFQCFAANRCDDYHYSCFLAFFCITKPVV
jgi:hypothetical protein